jgi:hypothetical protein
VIAKLAKLVPVLCLSLPLAGCFGPAIGEVRRVMRPSKPLDCPLEIVDVRPEDMMPGARFGAGGELEMIGMITIGADQGSDAMSEPIRSLVRPRACGMGGDIVSLLASGTGANRRGYGQQNIAFTVWAKRSAEPSTPKPF